MLLVNDGSKDDSGQICDSYAAQDKRIRVIHKDNSGVSDSRNMALDLAKGKYIQFLDSDDWITTDATNLFFRAAEDHHCDMVISDFYRVVGQRVSHKGDIDDDAVMTREDYARAYDGESGGLLLWCAVEQVLSQRDHRAVSSSYGQQHQLV